MDDEEYASMSKLLNEFINIPTIDKAWMFKSETDDSSRAMFLISQPSFSANKKRKSILSTHILRKNDNAVSFHWDPFPIETPGVSCVVPSPSGSKLLVIRNCEGDSPTRFEIWAPFGVQKEFTIPRAIHGPVYSDGWFEGISWNSDETVIAYVAEEPEPPKPTFTSVGYKSEGTIDKDCGSWTGQGDWEDGWGESYAEKRQPALYVFEIHRFAEVRRFKYNGDWDCKNTFSSGVLQVISNGQGGFCGEVRAVLGVNRELSVGQVVWAPLVEGEQYLVFVGWPSQRKLGMKYCSNRPCALYAVKAPLFEPGCCAARTNAGEDSLVLINLTQSVSSALFPCFSPDGKFLVFMSAKSAVDSGAHLATDSLHKIDWPSDGKLGPSSKIIDVVPVVMCPEDGCFPGLYSPKILRKPWLSDGCTMVLSSVWGSTQTILSINILSGKVSRISPNNSNSSWEVLSLDGDNIIAACCSSIDIPEIKYGSVIGEISLNSQWSWLDVLNPATKCAEKALSLLASKQINILKIPVRGVSDNLTTGARKPFEAIFVSSKSKKTDPLIVILHGGPHDVSTTTFSKSLAFLCSLGYSLLIVNYRGSLGFGEEALQSLPGKVGSQDVNDVLTAIDEVVDKGLVDPSKIAVVGISHGGFLSTHLIGQAPDRFAAAAARNPVCNLALMVGTTDIPDWCFFEAYGKKSVFTESPSGEHLALLRSKSPISHVSKVKTPTIFFLGAKDLRVPVYDGLQYARVLKEKGVETKVVMFPNDIHPINIPQSDFESFLNIGVWFNKYCR